MRFEVGQREDAMWCNGGGGCGTRTNPQEMLPLGSPVLSASISWKRALGSSNKKNDSEF